MLGAWPSSISHKGKKTDRGRKKNLDPQTMSPPPTGPPLPLHKSFAASAIAACSAEFLTLPLDTAKVRLQIQPTSSAKAAAAASTSSAASTSKSSAPLSRPKYSGLIGTIRTVAAEEGAGALWKGLVPSMHRQVLYGGEN
jgi:solute carrier family 25 uncoupling protein 8/9